MERTFVLVKPDGVQRGLIGEVITRLEKRGLKLISAKFLSVSDELAEKHYAVHKGKEFYPGLIRYITSAPVMAMVWEGSNAVAAVRQTMGATRHGSSSGSIRHDFALEVGRNLTHCLRFSENALLEIALWFHPSELIEWHSAALTNGFSEKINNIHIQKVGQSISIAIIKGWRLV